MAGDCRIIRELIMIEISYVDLSLLRDRLGDHGSIDLSLPRGNIVRDLTLLSEIIMEDPCTIHLAPWWEIIVRDRSSVGLTLLPRQIMRDAILRGVIRRCQSFVTHFLLIQNVARSLCLLNLTLCKESIAGTLDLDLYQTFLLGLARGLVLVGWCRCFQETCLALMARLITKAAREKKTVHR
jgi:hypothetical protein